MIVRPLDRFADISVLISYRTSGYVRTVASCCVRLAARELGLRLQVRRHRLHLRQAQILGDAMHDGDITHVALEGGQLLQDILRVLTCESREVLQAVRVGPVTGTASGHAFRLDAVLVDSRPRATSAESRPAEEGSVFCSA